MLEETANAQRLLLIDLVCAHEEPTETKRGAESSHLQPASSPGLCHAVPRNKPVAANQSFRPREQLQNKRRFFASTNTLLSCAGRVLNVQGSPGALRERPVGANCSPVRRHRLIVALKDDSRQTCRVASGAGSVTIAAAGAQPHLHTAAKVSRKPDKKRPGENYDEGRAHQRAVIVGPANMSLSQHGDLLDAEEPSGGVPEACEKWLHRADAGAHGGAPRNGELLRRSVEEELLAFTDSG